MAFQMHAATHERMLADVVEAFATKGDDGAWKRV